MFLRSDVSFENTDFCRVIHPATSIGDGKVTILGYLHKQDSNEHLLKAVRMVVAGKGFMSAETAQRFIGQPLGEISQTGTPIDGLSNRELEVFRLIGEGHSTGAIAKQLFLSTNTIEIHREHTKLKLGSDSGAKLTRAAVPWVLENG